ncbi:serine threonine kinase receptor associated protein [Phaffia rhodozyma]|uniref:Serine-threonine kinase receptor-associated protein n=1 Tax=Phaffia rhodozyma TaxID=264483 RepID=A0A0F7STB8_PHARH|nr:serine threonine kinase receptor associated protein [Phaffia rhodozyma]
MNPTPRSVPLVCSGHQRPVVHLNFSPLQEQDESYMLISSCKDGKPMLRDWTGDWVGTFLGHKGAVWQSKLSADTSRAATGSADFSAKIWDTYTGSCLHTFEHKHIVRTVALSPSTSANSNEGAYVLTGGQEKKLRIFNLARPDADPLYMTKRGDLDGAEGLAHEGNIRSVVWDSQDGNVAVSAGEEGVVRWWDLRTLEQTAELKLPDAVTSMELAHGGGTLCVTSGKSVIFLDIARRDPPLSIPIPHAPTSASLHPFLRDRFVAGSSADPWVRVYDLESGEERECYKGHHGPIHSVSYSPDGEMYASSSEDGTIRLWQTHPGRSYGLWQGTGGSNGANNLQLDQDEEELIWDAEKALVSHRTDDALGLYLRALHLPSGPSPFASLALGKLISRGELSFYLEGSTDQAWWTPRSEASESVSGKAISSAGFRPESSSSRPSLGSSLPSGSLSGSVNRESSIPRTGNGHAKTKRREWEKMNKAAGAFLVGLLAALEDCSTDIRRRSEESHEKEQSYGDGLVQETKSEFSSGFEERAWPAIVSLKLANDLFSNLLTLYRHGLLLPSDPIVPLPVPDPSSFLRDSPIFQASEGAKMNMWALGEFAAGKLLTVSWIVSIDDVEGINEADRELVKSLAMHAHYLLALTIHEKDLAASLSHLQDILSLGPVDLEEAQALVNSARPRASTLERKLATRARHAAASASMNPNLLSPTRISARPKKTKPSRPFVVSPAPSTGLGLPTFPFPRQLAPPKTSSYVSTTQSHTYHPSSRPGSPVEINGSKISARPSHDRTPSDSSSVFNPTGFMAHLSRRPSTYSFNTARSKASLSPSLFSLQLQDSRSGPAPGLVDQLFVEGEVLVPSVNYLSASSSSASRSKTWGPSGWNWFRPKSQAEGSLKRMQSGPLDRSSLTNTGRSRLSSPLASNPEGTNGRVDVRSVFPAPSKRNVIVPTQSSDDNRLTPPVTPSTKLKPKPALSISTEPLSPNISDSSPQPLSPLLPPSPLSSRSVVSSPASSTRRVHEVTRLTKFGDQSLDPQLRQLEMDSKVTMASFCDVCGTEGVNLPACPKCHIRFCSRQCRIGELGAGDGKRHICGILKTRKASNPQ